MTSKGKTDIEEFTTFLDEVLNSDLGDKDLFARTMECVDAARDRLGPQASLEQLMEFLHTDGAPAAAMAAAAQEERVLGRPDRRSVRVPLSSTRHLLH
jgi:hypothetical protein